MTTYVVAALLATLGARIATTAWRRKDARTMLGAFVMGFATLMLITEATALARDFPVNSLPVRLPGLLVIPVGGAVLLATRLRAVVRPDRELVVLRTIVITLLVTALVCGLAVSSPSLFRGAIRADAPFALVLLAVSAALLLITAWSATRTALLTRRPLDTVLCVGLIWLIPAEAGMATALPGDARWAVAHALQFAGFAMMAVQIAVDLSRQTSSRSLTGGLRATALVERSADFLGARVSALVDRLVDKDPSTAGHVERVAVLAVQMGEHLHLPTGRLRLLAAGGLLHDIGKLTVPTEVLQKPARLTDEEFDVVQRHPSDGRILLTELGGFHPLILELVESHHERVDGTGYPHGLAGTGLPMEVRILAVADVFDALTTDRPYRRACSAEDALLELDLQATTGGLDGRCVAALREVIGGEQLAAIRLRSQPPRRGAIATHA
ncbi:MAG: HD-GYP domain-containing protein [Solirubrobacteraceae bacterium]|nr:HD-GYP domain-containing protein [Solirubrobacteraceae bacterium]